jgi:acyl carrier protein
MSAMYDQIVKTMVTRFGVERDEILPGRTFSDLDMDSLSVVELILVVQNELGVNLDEDDATPDDTVAAAAERIAAYVTRAHERS